MVQIIIIAQDGIDRHASVYGQIFAVIAVVAAVNPGGHVGGAIRHAGQAFKAAVAVTDQSYPDGTHDRASTSFFKAFPR